MPKSVTLIRRSGVTMRLAGFTSRCTIPARVGGAERVGGLGEQVAGGGSGSSGAPGRSRSDSGWPSTSSITR